MTLAADGTLSGTPTLGGNFHFTVLSTAANGCKGFRAYTRFICGVNILPPTLANGNTQSSDDAV